MDNNASMTPLKVEILLWYYSSKKQYPFFDTHSAKEAIDEFCKIGILERLPDNSISSNHEALEVYINAVLAVPLPKKCWVLKY